MTNFEYYKDEILKMCREGDGVRVFALTNPNKLYKHNGNPCCSCSCELLEWLYSEHKERPKLTKQERKFCELFEGKDVWLVRNKAGNLYIYTIKPVKMCDGWFTSGHVCTTRYYSIFDVLGTKFDFIKWEDKEPWSVEKLLKLEVEE